MSGTLNGLVPTAKALGAAFSKAVRSAGTLPRSADAAVLNALRAEIQIELENEPKTLITPKVRGNIKMGGFEVEWDDPRTQDVVLRKRRWPYGSGCEEEVSVSALIGPLKSVGERLLPGDVYMKVCVKKMGLDSVLLFDCRIREGEEEEAAGSDYDVHCCSYFPSMNSSRGVFTLRSPKDQFLEASKEFLLARGVNTNLTDYLIHHMRQKEQHQYINWLHKLESVLSKSDSS